MITELRQEYKFSLKEILPFTSLSKSTYEYKSHPKVKKLSDKKLLSPITAIKKRNSGYGYWTVTESLNGDK